MAETGPPGRDGSRPLSVTERATLLQARRRRRLIYYTARVLSCGLLAIALLFRSRLGPYATPIIAAALASAVAPLVTPRRLRAPVVNQNLPVLARTWLLLFAVAFAGQEVAQIARQQIDLASQRACNQVAATVLYRQAVPLGTKRVVTCEQSPVSPR